MKLLKIGKITPEREADGVARGGFFVNALCAKVMFVLQVREMMQIKKIIPKREAGDFGGG